VRAHFELVARILELEGGAVDGELADAGGERNRAVDDGAAAGGRIDDLGDGFVQDGVIEGGETDADRGGDFGLGSLLDRVFMMNSRSGLARRNGRFLRLFILHGRCLLGSSRLLFRGLGFRSFRDVPMGRLYLRCLLRGDHKLWREKSRESAFRSWGS